MNKVIYSEKFRESMRRINESQYYIQKNFYDIILSKTEDLKIFPKMYQMFWEAPYRKISIQNYMVLYIIEKDTIHVSDIFSVKSKYSNHIYLKYN